mmetsp:Transcript_1346/g.3905  ORF Transcript_1346/g.3905 Transcript_1346/m.3905 type:complete len:203 (+) Transcript_1346:6957-7565(+)
MKPFRQGLEPRLQHHFPPDIDLLHEHHATPRNRGRRRDSEVLHLKHHGGDRAQLDDLPAVQTELLVIVQHRIHVFDPHRIDRAIEHDPLAVRHACVGSVAHREGQYAVGPFVSVLVEIAVQFALFDGFGVHLVHLDGEVQVPIAYRRQRVGEHKLHLRLAAHVRPNNHKTVAHHDRFPQLRALVDKAAFGLQAPAHRRTLEL